MNAMQRITGHRLLMQVTDPITLERLTQQIHDIEAELRESDSSPRGLIGTSNAQADYGSPIRFSHLI